MDDQENLSVEQLKWMIRIAEQLELKSEFKKGLIVILKCAIVILKGEKDTDEYNKKND